MGDATLTLQGKAAIVTGGAAGIGRATATRFASAGAHVVIGDVDEERGAKTVTEIKAGGHDAIFARCDVAVEADVRRLVDATIETYHRLDVLVNNAADLTPYGNVQDCTLEDWNRSVAAGLTGTFLCSKYAVAHMSAGASIVNIASVGGVLPFVDQAVYVTVKGAVIQLTRSMALDFGARGIRVNAIAPGAIDTRPVTDAQLRLQLARSPLGRKGRPEEIAAAALFLCSDEAAFITGVCLPVDGGWLLGRTKTN
jgi:meso-butanediol dehydrogenase / (S,S)-butanediol dehydrogenase / diacetyl reductase